MLDKLILEKSASGSYSQNELSNIASTSNHLREIIKGQSDFNESFLGGSYRRATMVKGISDVDVYFQYIGVADPRSALIRLRACLANTYPRTEVKQDKPSIHVDFDRIPFNITPYKKDTWSQNISIPDSRLSGWELVRFGELEASIKTLRGRNQKYIDLIKILKLWNYNYKRGLKNFDIEWRVVNMFSYPGRSGDSISGWIWQFFNTQGFYNDANNFRKLLVDHTYSQTTLEAHWLKFIDNK